MTYNPPPLPEYLLRNHTLNAIVGVPTDEEVEAIHDTIRAVNSMSAVPALYDKKLSTQLAQYLFTVQIAVYRNEYSSSENTYTPPSIPSNIPISLEPVVGAPSEEQLECAHNAVRTLENLANSPFFDSMLSVKLSQHLFNVQFARYIQDSNQGLFTQISRPANASSSSQIYTDEPSAPTTSIPPGTADLQEPQDATSVELDSGTPTTFQAVPPNQITSDAMSILQSNNQLDQLCAAQQETNRLLSENKDLLKTIRQTVASTNRKTYRSDTTGGTYWAYNTPNEEGELPWMCGLPDLYGKPDSTLSRAITSDQVAEYLSFYSIGRQFIDEQTRNLRPGQEAEAQQLLGHYLYYYRPPTSNN